MLAFEVWVNDRRLCTVSTATHTVLSTIVSWTARQADRINFHVGGIAKDSSGHHTGWDTPEPKIGDEIRIRLIDTEEYDEPDRRHTPEYLGSRD
jgi:hypothetical protein